MRQVIAVFDIGKTNKKLLLFDNCFKVVYQNEQKFPAIVDEDGFECDDIDLITSWIANSLEELIVKPEFDLVAVNFSTYGASLMFLDEAGQRMTPVYNYLKEVSPAIAAKLFAEYGGKDEFCRRTASPALGLLLNSGIQILWLQQEKPEVFSRVRSILHFPQYLAYKLNGKIVSEPTSIGCHTFMWDFDRMDYHPWVSDKGFSLPGPIPNEVVFPAEILGHPLKIGTGIHDSSASLAPYLKGSSEKFVLVSTGTWCINMNPFNKEPLTAAQLEKDCLCYLSPDKTQVKSSRLFMGHFHEVWAERLAKYYHVEADSFKEVKREDALMAKVELKFVNPVYFQKGKESFEEGLQTVDLAVFENYAEAYTKLVIDLTNLCVEAIQLVIPRNDDTRILYVSGGFARNSIFIELLKRHFPAKSVLVSEIDNSSALGAALVISGAFEAVDLLKPDLGIIE
jgi:sugar (pentulose or hexulose) kinase